MPVSKKKHTRSQPDPNRRQKVSRRSADFDPEKTLDHLLEGCQVIGHDWKYLYANETAARHAKTSKEELLGFTMMEKFPGIENTELFSLLRLCMEKGINRSIENEFIYPDGTKAWFELSIQSVPEGIFILSIDITKRKTSEGRVQQLIDVLRKLSKARDTMSVTEAVRTAARHLTGADGATFILRDGDQCYYVDEDAIAPLWKGQRFPMSACVSGWVMLHDQAVTINDIYEDARIPIEAYRPTFVKSLAMVPIRSGSSIVGAIGNYWARSYTASVEEMQLLQTLADAAAISMENIRLIHNLEHRVDERTKQLEATNKELEAFAYSISHDLRAPLRAIEGFSRILQQEYADKLDEEARRLFTIISSNTHRMGLLINDILSLSRVGRAELHKIKMNMTGLAQAVFRETVLSETHHTMDFKVDELPEAMGDPVLIRQVWHNLIANAIKYSSKKESIRIIIQGRKEDDRLIYSIQDNGVGFNQDYAHKLFGVFQRLHRQDEFEGTGVGLAIVQRIVHRHGGDVWAEGRLNEGATFYFSLPDTDE
ncbi:GAF domain-containing protein [bacterium]|nr:GAF domain-containing protein [bacterium]